LLNGDDRVGVLSLPLLRPAALAKTINEVGGQLFSTLFREKKNWANQQQELEKI
jgi:hypothetical protein